VQSTQRHEDAAAPVGIGDLAGAPRAGDAHLNGHQVPLVVQLVVQSQRLHVLIGQDGAILRSGIPPSVANPSRGK